MDIYTYYRDFTSLRQVKAFTQLGMLKGTPGRFPQWETHNISKEMEGEDFCNLTNENNQVSTFCGELLSYFFLH